MKQTTGPVYLQTSELYKSQAHTHTFCMISITNIVSKVPQSSVFIKQNMVNWLLGNTNKEYAYLVLLFYHYM